MAKDRYGCANRTRHKGCTNGRTIRRQAIEDRALDSLKERLLAPEAIAEAERGFRGESRRLTREHAVAAEADRRTIEPAARRIREIVSIIEKGGGHPALLERLEALEREKAAAEARRKRKPARRPWTLPDIGEAYRVKIASLADTLADADTRLEAAEPIRSLVGQVILTPGGRPGEVHISLGADPGAVTRKEEG